MKWVADGQRFNSEDEKRWMLHGELLEMYKYYGFKEKIVEIGGNYHERLKRALQLSRGLIEIGGEEPTE